MTDRSANLAALAALPPATAESDRLIPFARVEQIAGLKRTRIYAMIRAGSRWSEAEVRAWLEGLKSSRAA